MTNEIGDINYRKLIYFYENKISVHFKDADDIFYNGLILNLNREKYILILNERVKGNLPIALEDIKSDSIREFIEINGGGKEDDRNTKTTTN